MSLHFHVIQYLDDPLIGEGKNIAVVAHDGRRAHLRMLGVEDYRLRTGFFSAISPKAHASAWVYREWVEWFRQLVNDYGRDHGTFVSELVRLEQGRHLITTGEGVLEMGPKDSAEEAMDYLFSRLVQVPKRSPALAFEDRLEEVFSQAEIMFRADFQSGVGVELAPVSGGPSVFLEFSYFLSEPRPVGFRTLLFEGRPSKSIKKSVTAIASTFERANSIGFLKPNRCVVLCDKFGDEWQPYIKRLSELAHVLDASDYSTASNIHHIAYSGQVDHPFLR
jgi:hypothetical protein